MEDHSYSMKTIESTPSTSTLMILQQASGSSSDQDPTNFKCNMCDKSFQNRSGLYKHRRKVHSAVYEGRIKCFETGCSLSFRTSDHLKTHLTAKHHIKFTSEIKLFPNMKEFLVWKEDIEQKNDVRYVLLNGNSQYPDKKVQHFKCHRSGTYVPRVAADGRQRRLKSQGSAKMGQMCTSEVMVTEYTKDGHVKANYCATHYGHDMGLQQISHLFLTKTDKDSIAAQLLQGVSVRRILDTIRDNVSGLNGFQTTTRKNIRRIEQSYGMQDNVQKHTNDMLSVMAWVGDNKRDVVFYKNQGENSDALEEVDFALAIMSEGQRTILQQLGNELIICMDSTHGTNPYDFNLITLMAVDDFGAGFPLAFFYCNREDITALKIFIGAVKEKVGVIKSKIFMSDDAPQYYNAWRQTMGEAGKKLLCSWHVDRAWQKKLAGHDRLTQIEIYRALKTVQCETNMGEFENLSVKLKSFLATKSPEFGSYFEKEYSSRPMEWAYCYRHGAGINTNMYLESLHRVIKHVYMDGKKARRMDASIHLLCKLIKDKLWDRIIKIIKNKNSNDICVENRHEESKKLNPSIVTKKEDGSWVVISNQDLTTVYVVTKMVLNEEHSCSLVCKPCNVCLHMYACTCHDYLIKGNMCKHIHLVCVNERGDIPMLPDATTLEDHSKLHKVADILELVKKPQEELEINKKSLKALHLSLIPKIDSCTDKNILNAVTAQMQKINNMLSMGSSSQEHSNKEPPNKLMAKQLRFTSTKRKRKPNQILSKKKPNTIEINTIKDDLLNNN